MKTIATIVDQESQANNRLNFVIIIVAAIQDNISTLLKFLLLVSH